MKPKTLFSVFLLLFILIPFSSGAGDKQAAAISHKGPVVFFPSTKYEFAPVAAGVRPVYRHGYSLSAWTSNVATDTRTRHAARCHH